MPARSIATIYERFKRRVVPQSVRLRIRHTAARTQFYTYLNQRISSRIQDVDPGPHAPTEIILKTAGMRGKDWQLWSNRDFYLATAYTQMTEFFSVLEKASFDIRTLAAVLEFGCGSARLLRLLRCIKDLRLVGTDVNRDGIDWCRENVPGAEFYENQPQPPLSFAEEESFDFIMASSVFTHIALELQTEWLQEMCRVLRSGGIFLCTVLGENYEREMLTSAQRELLKQEGQLALDATDPQASHATQQAGTCDIFQSKERVLEVFGSIFHVADYICQGAGGQDLLVLRKP